jgi:hypothetical protein
MLWMSVFYLLTALRIPQLQQRRQNEVSVNELASSLTKVTESLRLARSMTTVGDYVSALQLSSEARLLCRGPLARLRSTVSLESRLIALESSISDLMTRRLIELTNRLDGVSFDNTSSATNDNTSIDKEHDQTVHSDSSRAQESGNFNYNGRGSYSSRNSSSPTIINADKEALSQVIFLDRLTMLTTL